MVTRRSIVISHPDFDLPGKAGIEAAHQMVQEMKTGNKEIIAELENQAASKKVKAEAAHMIDKIQYYIRKVDI